MRIFKNKPFNQWAKKVYLTDRMLTQLVLETEAGHYEAHLAAHLYKKRVALPGRGKRGGARTIIAIYHGECAFFVYGFSKNEKSSISHKELEALKRLAHDYLGLNDQMLKSLLKDNSLIEVQS